MRLTTFASSLLAALLMLTACGQQADDSPVVASVYGRELHQSALEGLVPAGIGSDDSLTIVNNYIDQWIRQAVILAKAEKNVEDDFERELQEYRNSLLAYAYERQIVDQMLDTMVSTDEIYSYYRQHKDDFLLKNSIVKAVYVVAPAKDPTVARLKKLVTRSGFSEHDIVDLEETASRHGYQGYFDADTWIPFYTLQSAVPVTAYNEESFLKQHRIITFTDDSLFYAARILSYKVTDEASPIELQHDNIKAIILNHRKTEILNNLHADLLKEAEEGGHVKKLKENS